ncbi:DUF2933 domain-containing protein [Bradyrhizobium cenepequi]|uniref:DUF2933 domain-containing protein n=1 Tax=Bradyrhizobium cenepequi TaxID=2821403 RepID=UPI0035E2318D
MDRRRVALHRASRSRAGALIWLPLLACPLMHFFMHGSHGGHGHRDGYDQQNESLHAIVAACAELDLAQQFGKTMRCVMAQSADTESASWLTKSSNSSYPGLAKRRSRSRAQYQSRDDAQDLPPRQPNRTPILLRIYSTTSLPRNIPMGQSKLNLPGDPGGLLRRRGHERWDYKR